MTNLGTSAKFHMANSSSSQLESLWADAVQRFENINAASPSPLPASTKPRSVDDLLSKIEDGQQGFLAFRQRRERLFQVLRQALTPIERLSAIAAGGVTAVRQIASHG